MANARAIANGNWSATSTWNGGVLPGNGDTVYSNGFTVTIDQNITIGGANNPTINAGSFVSGQWYEITSVGTTSFTGIGAASNTVGVAFIATGAGTGTGTAKALATLTTATNTPAGATTGGGGFSMATAYNVTADIVSGTTNCLTITHTTGTSSITNARVNGGTSSGAQGVVISGSGAVNFSTSTFTSGIGPGGLAYAVNLSGSASVTISGGVLVSPNNAGAVLVNTSATGTLSVSGVTTNLVWNVGITNTGAGSTSIANSTLNAGSNSSAYGASNTSTGTLTITGSTITASSSALGVLNSSTGTLNCSNCTFTAANGFNAVSSTNANANNRFSGTFVSSTNGTQAIYAPKWILNTTPTTSYIQHALDGITPSSFVRFFTADNTGLGPATSDVRSGVSYGSGLVGTCAVPNAGTVAFGVPVGNTTGTATLSAENIRTALGLGSANLDTQLANIPSAASTATAVWSAATRTTTGGTVDTLTNAPASVTPADIWGYNSRTLTSASGPTAVQIRQELDSNSTKLANLDAAVSTRLASTDYSPGASAPSASTIADAVWAAADKTGYSLTSAERSAIAAAVESSILNESDGQQILNAIVGAIGNQNIDQVALVAAIRSDLERTGGKLINLDTTVSSRLAASSYQAPTTPPTAAENASAVRAELTEISRLDVAVSSRLAGSEATKLDAVKAKTDALNTDRLSQVATTSIVGSLLAQVNS